MYKLFRYLSNDKDIISTLNDSFNNKSYYYDYICITYANSRS